VVELDDEPTRVLAGVIVALDKEDEVNGVATGLWTSVIMLSETGVIVVSVEVGTSV
jgi:hypothetical protein